MLALQQHEAFVVVVQVPGASGHLRSEGELRAIADKAHENGATVVAAADLLALTRIVEPAAWGADIAVGSSQRFGVPLFGGGPHAGYIAVRKGLSACPAVWSGLGRRRRDARLSARAADP